MANDENDAAYQAFLRDKEKAQKQATEIAAEIANKAKPKGMLGRIADQQLKEKVQKEVEEEREDTDK